MANYTRVNLKQVENVAPQFGIAEGMESRFAGRDLALERVGLTAFTLAPGFRVPFGHKHVDQEEVYVVVSGSARIKIEEDVIDLDTFDAVHVPGSAMRNLEAGPDGAEVIAFGQRAGRDESTLQPGWWAGD